MENEDKKVPGSFEVDLNRFAYTGEFDEKAFKLWAEYLYSDSTPEAPAEMIAEVTKLVDDLIERRGWEEVLKGEIKLCPMLRNKTPVEQEVLVKKRLFNLAIRLRLDPLLQHRGPIYLDIENDGGLSVALEKHARADKLIIGNKMRDTVTRDPEDPIYFYDRALVKLNAPDVDLSVAIPTFAEIEAHQNEIGAFMSRDQIAARLPDTDLYHTSNGVIPAQVSLDVKEELVKSLVSLWVDVFGKDKLIESYVLNNPKLVEGLSDEAIEAAVMDGLNKLAGNSIDLGRAIRMQNSWCFPQGRFYPDSASKVIGQLSEFLNKDGTLDLYAIVNRNKTGDAPKE